MSRIWLCLAVVALLLAAGGGWAADWPQWRGPTVNGIAPDTGINKNWAQKPPTTLWTVPMGDQGYAGPSVADGKVFIIDHEGNQDIVKALDFTNGQEIWRYAYKDTAQPNNGFARSTPIVNEGKVYTVSRLGVVNCLEENTGKLVWTHNLVTEFGGKKSNWEYSMSVLIDGNKAILEPGGANLLAAVDKTTGQTLWVGGGSDTVGYATPVLATIQGVTQYVVFSLTGVRGLATKNGQELWMYPWKTPYDVNAATPLILGNRVFITSGYGVGCAMLEIKADGGKLTPTLLWQSKDLQGKFSTPVFYGGILWGGGEGNFAGIYPETGKTVYKQGNFDQGSVLAVDGVLLVLFGGTGKLVMMTPTGPPQVLGEITPLGGQSWTAPIMVDGKLLIRNTKTLACLDMK